MQPLFLMGCRHDILGHYLKAIGLLRVLALCAEKEYRDPEAEGWWDVGQACFVLRSAKHLTLQALVDFFKKRYIPTPIFAAWNKETGAAERTARAFGAYADYQIASDYAKNVVSAEEKRKRSNVSKMTSSEAYAAYRDDVRHDLTLALDAVSLPRFCRNSDNPLLLAKGIAGRAHLWRSYWDYLCVLAKRRTARREDAFNCLVIAALTSGDATQTLDGKLVNGKGTPFFPDAIKSYNLGSRWVQEDYPFNALDYVLAVEGALALRGSVARTLGASTRRFAAFPFVFDSAEDMVDDQNEIKGTASALWLPIWERPTTFAELSSFIGDAQARLPGKDARFSAEFVRALYAQGVDAGFSGWQEFRFKMKGSRVPWITTGRYVSIHGADQDQSVDARRNVVLLNLGLAPLDENRFLDQFEVLWSGNKVAPRSPHFLRAEISEAMETAALEPSPENCIALLETIFRACRRLCISESFREKLRGGRASFFAPLPMAEWEALLNPLDVRPEFRIARALASITGSAPQNGRKREGAQPMLGSLLPLKIGRSGWYLPDKGERQQCVWSGEDLPGDLASVFRRRYLDSLDDDFPALRGLHGARLDDVMAFLQGDLDDFLIARWTEALSLIGKRSEDETFKRGVDSATKSAEPKDPQGSLDIAYAALRALIELECEWQGSDRNQWKKRRSQQPFALMCERSALSLTSAVSESLRWISIWGVPNPWGPAARAEQPRIQGRYIIRIAQTAISPTIYHGRLAERLAAAVCIPLRWQDRYKLYQTVTLPPGVD
jgi:CRISPR-associated protein Csx17